MTYTLKQCVWEITLECCFSCKHCGSKAGKKRGKELDTQECLKIVNELAELECQRVSLIGGEIFMRKDWDVIVSALTSHKIRTSIITNGFILSDDIIKRLKDSNVTSVAVSLDGTKECHDKLRQLGSFDRAISAIETLVKNEIPVSVITTLNSKNVYLLKEMYSLLMTKGISAWQLQACSPMGNAALLGTDIFFNFNDAIQFVKHYAKDAPFILGVAHNIGYYTEAEGFLRGNLEGKAHFLGCTAGITSIGIDSIGNVRGCESMYDDHFVEGNLKEQSLRQIWESPDNFLYNRKATFEMLTGSCKDCAHKIYCMGGCRSYNYFVHKKLYESPNCAKK